MSDEREVWDPQFRKQQNVVHTGILFLIGAGFTIFGEYRGMPISMYAGIGIMVTAVYVQFSVIRPLARWIVERVPFLANKNENRDGPGT